MTTNYTGPSTLTHALHGLPHIDVMHGWTTFGNVTIERVIEGTRWEDYLESAAFVPGLLFGIFMLYIVAFRLPYLISGRCSCCKCDRCCGKWDCCCGRWIDSKNIGKPHKPKSTTIGVILLFFVLSTTALSFMLLTYNWKLVENGRTDFKDKIETLADFQDHAVDVAKDAHSQLTQAVQTLNDLVNQSQTCSCVSQANQDKIAAARDQIGQGGVATDRIVTIIDLDLHIRDYTHYATDYNTYANSAAIVLPLTIFVFMSLLLIFTYGCKSGPWRITQYVIEYLYLLVVIPVVALMCVYFYIAIIGSDALEDPYATILHFKRGDSDVVQYYLYCDNPLVGGPLNPRLDDTYSFLSDNLDAVNDFVDEVNTTAHTTLYPTAVELSANITNMLTFINQTRLDLSCATPHDLGVSVLNLGRDTIAPNLEMAIIVGFLLFFCAEVVCYLQARPTSNNNNQTTTKNENSGHAGHDFIHSLSSPAASTYEEIPQSASGISGAAEGVNQYTGY
jgi:hypothetical protein